MDEIISGMQVIKMYAWEKPFAKLIANVRKMELRVIRKFSYIRGLQMTLMIFTARMALFCTMVGIALVNGAEQITAAQIFTISVLFGIICQAMLQRFCRGVAEVAEVLVAIKRLEEFLCLDEKEIDIDNENSAVYIRQNDQVVKEVIQVESNLIQTSQRENENISISMKNVQARWTMPSNQSLTCSSNDKSSGYENNEVRQLLTLNGLNIDFPKDQLIGVIGPVGCGKSSLLQAILHELPLESGSINIDGTISYASQEPWVFAASVRQNILFGQEYDRDRYDAVIKCCALQRDFEQFENGDLTIIGERGVSVSGGQKARIK